MNSTNEDERAFAQAKWSKRFLSEVHVRRGGHLVHIEPGSGQRPVQEIIDDIKTVVREEARIQKVWEKEELARSVRADLAACSNAVYGDMLALLAPYREQSQQAMSWVSYLAPTEPGWFSEIPAPDPETSGTFDGQWLYSATDADQIASLLPAVHRGMHVHLGFHYEGALPSILDGCGPPAATVLRAWAEAPPFDSTYERKLLAAVLAVKSPSLWSAIVPQTFGAKVTSARRDAFRRGFTKSPGVAAQVLMPRLAVDDEFAAAHRYLAEDLLAKHPGAIEIASDHFSSDTQAFLTSLHASLPSPVVAADPSMLPEILVSPPWKGKKAAVRRTSIDGLEPPPVNASIVWEPGQRSSWTMDRPVPSTRYSIDDWDNLHEYYQLQLLCDADPEQVRPLLASSPSLIQWGSSRSKEIKHLVAVFELELLPNMVALAEAGPKSAARAELFLEVLLPYRAAELVQPMIDLAGRRVSASDVAHAWLRRHGDLVAPHLVARVLNSQRKGRHVAEMVLRRFVLTNRDDVDAAAAHFGAETQTAIAEFFSIDPLMILPSRPPSVPGWLRLASLTPPLLRKTGTALPPEAVINVLTMVGLSQELPYKGLDVVRDSCTPESLAEFALSVYRRWHEAGRKSSGKWVCQAIEHFADDSIVDQITGDIDKTVKVADDVRKMQIEMLDMMGSDAAMAQLFALSKVVPRKVTKRLAVESVNAMAARRGLTADELADRLIPSFDLDAHASMVLDFGPRQFTVGFDEQLKPTITTHDGKTRKSLPKPAKGDDAALAAPAHKRFTRLKREVKATAHEQLKRFEAAMVTGRRWTQAEFHTYFVSHPLMRHLTQRLIWGLYETTASEPAGVFTAAFRVAEDQSYATSEDGVFVPGGDDALVGLAHPIEMGDQTQRWAEVLGDYELLQPFEQLGRAIHTLDDLPDMLSFADGMLSARYHSKIPYQRVLGLASRGWTAKQHDRFTGHYSRPLRTTAVELHLNPGFSLGRDFSDQFINPVDLGDAPEPIDISELARDLLWLSRPPEGA